MSWDWATIFEKDLCNMETPKPYLPLDQFPTMLTVKDLISILGIGRNTAYALLKNKTIRSIRIGSSIRIPKEALVEYIHSAQE